MRRENAKPKNPRKGISLCPENTDSLKKGDDTMNAYAVKPNMPFVTEKKLKRTPASKENRDMAEYMDSHEFSFRLNKLTGKFVCSVKKSDEN